MSEQTVFPPRFEILQQHDVYQGFFRLARYRLRHALFAGEWSPPITRELLERGHAAAVLLYDPNLDSVVLVEQFRVGALHTPNPWLLEVVAGIVEPEESPEEVALRESEEEAGLIPDLLEFICEYHVSPGGTSERIALYCGRVNAAQGGGLHGLSEETEDIRAHVISVDQVLEMLDNGEIRSATPIIALQWLALRHQQLRARWLR